MNSEKASSVTKASVMLFGTFHFANPGKDKVKNRVCDVMTESSQAYLQELAHRISAYHPTAILLEYDFKDDQKVNARYAQYRKGNYQLAVNEIEQLGFRLAKLNGLSRVESFDQRSVVWNTQSLFKQLKQEPEIEKRFHEAIQRLSESEELYQSTLTLQNLLRRYNEPEMDHLNKSLYILTNVAGVDRSFAGADASASWWHRNFRMLARIQKFSRPGERLLVIGGQGHTAVIRDLIKFDSNITLEDINLYL